MKITISPIAALPGGAETQVTVSGDTITVDGTPYDLSAVPEGGEATPQGEHPFVGKITRTNGELACTVRFLFEASTAEPVQPSDPAHWVATLSDGDLPDLIVRKP
ncbi:MAG: hypothetical protein ACP5DX_04170 [Paracoccaceae bacterium]